MGDQKGPFEIVEGPSKVDNKAVLFGSVTRVELEGGKTPTLRKNLCSSLVLKYIELLFAAFDTLTCLL